MQMLYWFIFVIIRRWWLAMTSLVSSGVRRSVECVYSIANRQVQVLHAKIAKCNNKFFDLTFLLTLLLAWSPLKGHTYLNLQLSVKGFFKYIWTFSGHQALKG